jgi:hypothetical protein
MQFLPTRHVLLGECGSQVGPAPSVCSEAGVSWRRPRVRRRLSPTPLVVSVRAARSSAPAPAVSAAGSTPCEHLFVKAQGHARAQYRRAIERKNLMGTEVALRGMGAIELLEALDCVGCSWSSGRRSAAVRWHGRLEREAAMLTLPESGLALAALIALCQGDREALGVLRRPLRRVKPLPAPRVSLARVTPSRSDGWRGHAGFFRLVHDRCPRLS